MKSTVILVTEPEYIKGKAFFEEASSDSLRFESAPEEESALADRIKATQARGAIVGVLKYTGQLYKSLPEGGIIARFGVGHDGIDKAQAKAKKIYVTNTPGALDISVAEHAVFLMGALARNISAQSASVRSGEWSPNKGIEMLGKTLSVIGFGRIGRETARIVAMGFGMDIFACDAVISEEQERFVQELSDKSGRTIHLTDSLPNAMSAGDFISLHLPLIAETRGLIDADKISIMKSGSYLINTARGGIVDENALYDALDSGHLAGAAFDVFRDEPYVPVNVDKDLRNLDNFIMTPHISSNTDMSNRRMAEMCVANARSWINEMHEDMNLVSL
ncbi:MAG: NAD(P)-dependent oxidoreductase [Armatimonadota bacterium]